MKETLYDAAADFSAPTFVTIIDLDRLEVLAYVDETDIGRVFVGRRFPARVCQHPACGGPGCAASRRYPPAGAGRSLARIGPPD